MPNSYDSLFEPIERKSGLKFYLAKASMDSYADIRLVENGNGCVQFEIIFEQAPIEGG